MGRVPPMDPDAPRSRVYRASEAFAQTRGGRWLAIHLAPRIDKALHQVSGGRAGAFPGARVATVETKLDYGPGDLLKSRRTNAARRRQVRVTGQFTGG